MHLFLKYFVCISIAILESTYAFKHNLKIGSLRSNLTNINQTNPFCNGVIVGSDSILVSANCLLIRSNNDLYFKYKSKNYSVLTVEFHDSINEKTLKNNIALIHVNSTFPLKKVIKVRDVENIQIGEVCQMIGIEYSSVVKIVNIKICKKLFRNKDVNWKNQICVKPIKQIETSTKSK